MDQSPPSPPNPGAPPVSVFADHFRLFQHHPAIKPPRCPGIVGALDHYELLSLVGQGGMGLVFKARDTTTDRIVAVKLLRNELAGHAQAQHRFAREARHMSKLRHPNIVEVLHVGTRQDVPYFVMPFLERGSLAGLLHPDAPLDRATCLRIATGIAQALQYAHSKGITHRDLKPGNVLLDQGDLPLLTDFGLARTLYNDSLIDIAQAQHEGTAAYMSPQLARLEAEDTRCDIYAFGALLYEMLTGRVPYEGESNAIILEKIKRGPPVPIRELRPDAPADLVRIAETAMAREHRDRYASMNDVQADLERVAHGEKPLGCRAFAAGRSPNLRRFALVAAVVCVLALVALIAGVSWLRRERHQTATTVAPVSVPSAPVRRAPNPSHLKLVRIIEGANHRALRDGHLADWDGDKHPDLVFVDGDELCVITFHGERIPSLPLKAPHTTPLTLGLVQDVNGDGRADAFVSWANGTNLHIEVWNHRGDTLRAFSFQGTVHTHSKWGITYSQFAARQIADLDADGRQELLAEVATTWGRRPRGLVCFDLETGREKWFYETAPFPGPLLLRDLDKDGKLDVVFGSHSADNSNSLPDGTDDSHAYLYAVSHQGKYLWRPELCDFFASVEPIPGPAFGKEKDLIPALVVSSFDFRSTNTLPESGRVQSLNRGGHVVGNSYDVGLRLMSCLSTDLEGDGQPEMLCTDRAGYLHVLNSDLTGRCKLLLTTNQFSYVDLCVVAVAPLGLGKEKYVVLRSAQVEARGERVVGNDPAVVSKDAFYDVSLIVLDAKLDLVAKHVVFKERFGSADLVADVIPPLPDEPLPQLLVRSDKVYFYKLQQGSPPRESGDNPSK